MNREDFRQRLEEAFPKHDGDEPCFMCKGSIGFGRRHLVRISGMLDVMMCNECAKRVQRWVLLNSGGIEMGERR